MVPPEATGVSSITLGCYTHRHATRRRGVAGHVVSMEERDMRLDGRIVIVTGASSGFGRATAVRVAEEGASVVIADIDERGGRDSAVLVEKAGGEAEVVVGDIATEMGARGMVESTLARFGTLDVLVNNAGIASGLLDDTWDAPEETWDRIIRVDLKSVYLCSRAVIPTMLAKGSGSIVNVASIAATRSVGGSPYAAAKAGIVGYTRHVAAELGARGVRMNCVSPGFMRTPMTTGERLGLDDAAQEERLAAMGRRVPMQRTGTVQDIAAAIAYLASDDAAYITGQEIVVDGGYLVG
jgi:NAD(P)-dependent dehydrogenase (short-subunit alcohol dehydrogenase family)